MSTLTIKGHATRGSEVIALLEMIGGINKYNLRTTEENLFYCLSKEDNVIIETYFCSTTQNVFTLEEFESKYPYKVGDKVWLYYENLTIRVKETITRMSWCNKCNCVLYNVSTRCNLREYAFTPYKEETMDRKYNVEEYLKVWEETEKGLEVVVNDNFELKEDSGKFYIIKKQPRYPKTYKECCKIMKIHLSYELFGQATTQGEITNCAYTQNLLKNINKFQKILICRDAYWKIAGEQIGLGKPWEPDWSLRDTKYIIVNRAGVLCLNEVDHYSRVLAFPTREMRDAFYKNFKDLIEECKELL